MDEDNESFTAEVQAAGGAKDEPEINWAAMKGKSPEVDADPDINPQRFDLIPPEQHSDLARACGQLAESSLMQGPDWHVNEAYKYMNAHVTTGPVSNRHGLPNFVLAARQLLLADQAFRSGSAPAVI